MPKPYSYDLRVRVIELIEAGSSRREAAELYGISPSVVVIWAQRWKQTGSISAKPSGGSISPLEEHAEFLLGLIVEQPDLTLDASWRCRRPGSSAVGPQCGGSTNDTTSASKKTLYAEEQRRADIVRARRRWMREQGMFDPARLVFIDETCTNTAMVRLRGRARRGERLVDYAPHGAWKTVTFVGALRQRGMTAPFVIEGAMNGPMFLAYVRQCLVPTLKRGDGADGQSAGAQGRRRRGGDPGGGSDADLSPEVFSRPQPDRTGLQQTQGASAQGGRAYHSASLASDRSRRYEFQRAGMQELFSPCGLCSNLIGIRSSLPT